MVDVHEYFNHDEMIPTWTNNTVRYRIDYIFTSECLITKTLLHEILNVEDTLETDHKALTITLKLKEDITIEGANNKKTCSIGKIKLNEEEWKVIAENIEEEMINTTNEEIIKKAIDLEKSG